MKENFDAALQAILHHEGGYVNNPADPGGRTNLGVTQRVWEEWLGHPVDEKTMRALTPEMVAPMYKTKYWDKIKGDELPAGVDYAVFDAAINSGPGRAAKWLQECVNAPIDGGIGPKTLTAVASFDPAVLVENYAKLRLNFMQALPQWGTFGKGWSRRVAEVQTAAKSMTV